MKWFVPFAFLMVFETFGNYFAGLFGTMQNIFIAILSLVIYAIANYFWLQALKDGSGLARGTVYFGVAVIIFTALIGFAFYEEGVTIITVAGIITGTASLFLLSDDIKQVRINKKL
jgi:multidrug transporter EmrE-like cation transporter